LTYFFQLGKPEIEVTTDEEFTRVNFEKFPKLATVFQVTSDLRLFVFFLYIIGLRVNHIKAFFCEVGNI
jgi:hypothetical protein